MCLCVWVCLKLASCAYLSTKACLRRISARSLTHAQTTEPACTDACIMYYLELPEISPPRIAARAAALSAAARAALVLAMVEGGSKGRGSRGRGASSRGRGRGAEPPPPRPPRREEAPAHNHEPAADADGIVADDEEYLALATSITNMMRDEVAGRDKLLKRVSELESALTAAQHGEKCHPPAWPVRLLRLFRARLLWVAWHSQGRETGSLGAQPLPRLIERTSPCRSMPLTPLLLNYPGGTQGDGGPARAQQRPTSAVA